ncbi:diacylglycerol/lipid kinase family protein [Limibacillus halophilus]|uniref:DAGKc domain-containing protein n=1 Tax=Limibacillus halophilus TaxID=1579333 RepID=A0A839SZV4_9PROT|nr:diacylglycerol kinase family protein [Limibacillus halophilus]MBB3066575.1 hypothetical protein [Limibacillus halophilus]
MADRAAKAMNRFGLVVNPHSQRNKRGLPALREAVQSYGDLIDYVELDGIETLGRTLRRFADAGLPLVAIAGGDGTVVASMTEYLVRQPDLPRPAIAILSAGMTNMTAADIGLKGRADKALARLVKRFQRGEALWRSETLRRSPIVVSGGGMGPPQAGFFLGGAGIYQGIEYCRDRVHTLGLEAGWANAATMASLLVQQMIGGRLLKGQNVDWRWDGGEKQSDSLSVVVATTLDRLVVGTRPFWNQPRDPSQRSGFSVTLVQKPGAAFWWSLPRLLFGKADRKLNPKGCHSGEARVLELWMDSPFTIDGQLFDCHATEPLKVELGHSFEFVRI